MSSIAQTRRESRITRHRRVRKKVHGTAERPRLAVFRSNKHVVAQVIDDDSGRTLAASSWLDLPKSFKGAKTEQAAEVGKRLAEAAKKAGVETAVFDRGGYLYHGRVKAPEGISFEVPVPTQIVVTGIDKEVVGQVAADIRSIRKPAPSTGKGVRYAGERVLRKAGKAGKK